MISQRENLLYLFDTALDQVRDILDARVMLIRHSRLTMVAFLGIIVVTAYLFDRAPKGFLPNDDSGQIVILTEAGQDISFEAMKQQQQRVMDIVLKDPNVAGSMSFIGQGNGNSSLNNGRIVVALKPREERLPADEVVRQMRPKFQNLVGMQAFVQNLPPIRIGARIIKSQYLYTVQGSSLAELTEWVPRIEAKLKTLPEIINITTDLQIARPQVTVQIDREKASSLNVSVQQIQVALNNAFRISGRFASLLPDSRFRRLPARCIDTRRGFFPHGTGCSS